jgi:hypothetical protein
MKEQQKLTLLVPDEEQAKESGERWSVSSEENTAVEDYNESSWTRRSFRQRSPLSLLKRPSLFRIAKTISSCIIWLVVAFHPRYLLKDGLQPKRKEHVTSYLDSLRGWAAVIVYFFHFNYYTPYGGEMIFQQPFVRLFCNGRAMVDLFFVVSGYALCYKALLCIRNRQAGTLLDTLTSSVFRRYIRLYGTCAAGSFAAMVALRLNWWKVVWPRRRETTIEQIMDWAMDFLNFSNIFHGYVKGYVRTQRRELTACASLIFYRWWEHPDYQSELITNKYLGVMWSIPVE